MKKCFVVLLLAISSLTGSVFAQNKASGESEFGTDGKGGTFFSQYLLADGPQWNGLARYFIVNNVLQRAEFAIGPTLPLGNGGSLLKLTVGGTTDREIMTATTVLLKVAKRDIVYIGDGKIATQRDSLSAYYQKLFIPLLPNSTTWQFRAEHLFVDGVQAFMRIGFEYQYKTGEHTHLYFAPFADPVIKSAGAQIGFRFFQ